MSLISLIIQHSERVGVFHYRVDNTVWRYVLDNADKTVTFISFWVDEQFATMALFEDDSPIILSTPLERRRYLAPSKRFPAAQWEERIAFDLYGIEALSARDDRSALDDGCWPLTWPLAQKPIPVSDASGASKLVLDIAPSRTNIPGLLGLKYDISDSCITKLDVQISMGHRGVLSQLKGLTPAEALPLIGRVSAAGFVAHPLAFIRAVEQAQAQTPSPRERDTRLIMLEIERISLHLFDISRVSQSVGADLLATHCDHAREEIAQICMKSGVSRRLTDVIRLLEEGQSAVVEIVPFAHAVLKVVAFYIDRIKGLHHIFSARLEGVAIVPTETAWTYGIGGVIGRASGRYLDMRSFDVGMRLDALRSSGRHQGDALTRNDQRLSEIRDSMKLIERILASIGLEDNAPNVPMTGEGLGVVESARGDIWYWIKLQQGKLDYIHVRDPVLPVLAILEDILAGHMVNQIDTALCSLGISPAGAVL